MMPKNKPAKSPWKTSVSDTMVKIGMIKATADFATYVAGLFPLEHFPIVGGLANKLRQLAVNVCGMYQARRGNRFLSKQLFRHSIGIERLQAGEYLAVGDLVTVGADGKAVKMTAGDKLYGIMMAYSNIPGEAEFLVRSTVMVDNNAK